MEKNNNISQLKKPIPLFGNSMNMIDTKVHKKIFEEIIEDIGKFQIDPSFKPKLGGKVSLKKVLLILTSTMLGYVRYLKDGIENYQKLEKEKRVLFSKVIYGFDDLIDLIPQKKLDEILELMTKWEFNDNCPLFAKITHNLLRMYVNLANRKGPKGETMTKLFKDDGDFLDLIMAEKNPEQLFAHIKFSPDFIVFLKEISCTNVCLQFYNKVNAINKKKQTNPETTRVEIIQIIDLIINKKCYFAKSLPTGGETLYNDDILLNANMSNYSLNDASKLDLIFTLLHEMSHVKRINFSFDSDHFTNTPKEFINQFKEFNDMNKEEKNKFWEIPEIGEAFEFAILGGCLYQHRAHIIRTKKYRFKLLDFRNWNYEAFKDIEEEINAEISEDPNLAADVDVLSHRREGEGILRCTTRLDYNSNEYYALSFDITKK